MDKTGHEWQRGIYESRDLYPTPYLRALFTAVPIHHTHLPLMFFEHAVFAGSADVRPLTSLCRAWSA